MKKKNQLEESAEKIVDAYIELERGIVEEWTKIGDICKKYKKGKAKKTKWRTIKSNELKNI